MLRQPAPAGKRGRRLGAIYFANSLRYSTTCQACSSLRACKLGMRVPGEPFWMIQNN